MKAVLVIDMPTKCINCPFNDVDDDMERWICYASTDSTAHVRCREEDIDIHSKPEWCPLKPLPQKEEKPKVSGGLNWDNAFTCGFIIGWNACIEEIENETDRH